MRLDTMRKEYTDLRAKGLKIVDDAEAAKRDLSETEHAEVKDVWTKAADLAGKIKAAEETSGIADKLRGLPEYSDGAAAGSKDTGGQGAAGDGDDRPAGQKGQSVVKTPGQLFVDSPQLKALKERFPSGPPERTHIDIPPVDVPFGVKTLVGMKALADLLVQVNDNATSGSSTLPTAVRPDWQGIYAPVFQPTTVLDLITVLQTSSDLVQFVREDESIRDLNAAIVTEATKTVTASDTGTEVKPQSGFGFEAVSAAVKTIAAWIAATNQSLSDLPALRGLIDQFLGRDLALALELEIVAGSGSGNHFRGIVNTTNIQTQAFDADLMVTTRKALTKVEAVFAQATGWIMAPADVETLDLMQDATGRYYGNGPFALGPRTLWGLPIAKCFSLTAGTAVGGDLASVAYYDREQTTLSVGTVNDDFIRNIRRILAETRGALAVRRPKSLVKVTVA